MSPPALLLDVDGVLNPFAAKPSRRPEGYQTHRLRPRGWEYTKKPLRVWLNPDHGPMLTALAETVELVWCTTWVEEANTMIGPQIGLPDLPVIDVGDYQPDSGGVCWKVPAVEAWAGERALAWLDDDFGPGDQAWAAERTARGAPTLLVTINPAVGLQPADVDRVGNWAAEPGHTPMTPTTRRRRTTCPSTARPHATDAPSSSPPAAPARPVLS